MSIWRVLSIKRVLSIGRALSIWRCLSIWPVGVRMEGEARNEGRHPAVPRSRR
jgi:hypothetical protein